MKQTQQTELKHRNVAFKATAVGDAGTFSGYASVFGNEDTYGEIVAPGAFSESLAALTAAGDPLPVLWQHNASQPIGGSDMLVEDNRGLKTEGFLLIDEIPQAKAAHTLMKRRIVKGLSIGYYVRDSSYDEKTGIRTLKALDLVEYSIVTFPANELATVDNVKAAAKLKTIREFESFLRDVGGFSAQQAKAIASAGWGGLSEARDAPGETLLDLLSSFKL
jgi:HK97 family phage prohead protease